MREHGYPDTEQHQRQHRRLIEQINEYRQRHDRGEKRLDRELLPFLAAWVTDHILLEDRRFGAFLQREVISKILGEPFKKGSPKPPPKFFVKGVLFEGNSVAVSFK